MNSIDGTIIEARIRRIAELDINEKLVYPLKEAGIKTNKSAHMYSNELLKEIQATLNDYNLFCGYIQGQELTSPNKLKKNEYKVVNMKTLARLGNFK